MKENGISYELQRRYRVSKWLTPVGTGVMVSLIYRFLSFVSEHEDHLIVVIMLFVILCKISSDTLPDGFDFDLY